MFGLISLLHSCNSFSFFHILSSFLFLLYKCMLGIIQLDCDNCLEVICVGLIYLMFPLSFSLSFTDSLSLLYCNKCMLGIMVSLCDNCLEVICVGLIYLFFSIFFSFFSHIVFFLSICDCNNCKMDIILL